MNVQAKREGLQPGRGQVSHRTDLASAGMFVRVEDRDERFMLPCHATTEANFTAEFGFFQSLVAILILIQTLGPFKESVTGGCHATPRMATLHLCVLRVSHSATVLCQGPRERVPLFAERVTRQCKVSICMAYFYW